MPAHRLSGLAHHSWYEFFFVSIKQVSNERNDFKTLTSDFYSKLFGRKIYTKKNQLLYSIPFSNIKNLNISQNKYLQIKGVPRNILYVRLHWR